MLDSLGYETPDSYIQQVLDLFGSFDANQDGVIDFGEFGELWEQLAVNAAPEDVAATISGKHKKRGKQKPAKHAKHAKNEKASTKPARKKKSYGGIVEDALEDVLPPPPQPLPSRGGAPALLPTSEEQLRAIFAYFDHVRPIVRLLRAP